MANKPSDIASLQKLQRDMQQLSRLRRALPWVRPFLRLAGVDLAKMEKPLVELSAQEKELTLLVQTLDRFNDLFASRGWIVYDWLNTEVSRAAIAAAEAGDMAQAEMLLVQHYSGDQVAIELRTLHGVKAFQSRMRLAELALNDYREGRYHACVPVVLALLDGMVNELGDRGFFSTSVDLSAWDSIAACDRGLKALQDVLFTGRYKTTTDPIEVPYRNGILHGMDLAYDTPLVAAKCWVALFATADWARRIEQGKKEAPALEPDPTWGGVLKQLRKNEEDRARLDAWQPRGPLDPAELSPCIPGSPEAVLTAFLDAWRSRNYGVMAKHLHAPDGRSLKARAGELRAYYQQLSLQEFMIEARGDVAPAVTEITVRGVGTQYGKAFDRLGTFRLVCFDAQLQPKAHGDPEGAWFVMSWNPWQTPGPDASLRLENVTAPAICSTVEGGGQKP